MNFTSNLQRHELTKIEKISRKTYCMLLTVRRFAQHWRNHLKQARLPWRLTGHRCFFSLIWVALSSAQRQHSSASGCQCSQHWFPSCHLQAPREPPGPLFPPRPSPQKGLCYGQSLCKPGSSHEDELSLGQWQQRLGAELVGWCQEAAK